MRLCRIFLMAVFIFISGVPLVMANEDELKDEINALKVRLTELENKLQAREEEEIKEITYQPSAVEITEPSWPVAGIYTVPDTKDLGKLTGMSWLEGTRIRGWIDTNYVWNFNNADRGVVDANQGSSSVKGHDISIEGRAFDVHHNSFNLSLAELEIEKVPDLGGVGYKFDIAFGETQEIIVDTIRATLGPSAAGHSVTDFDKAFQHASVSYLAPLGRGLRIDAGKFVTHIGGETIETVKNWNYSHSYFYTYAIPFQDTGIHFSYPWTDTFYTDLYVLNGWNATIDNNSGKSIGPSIGWVVKPWLSIYANYLAGPEQTDNTRNLRQLVDTQIFLGPFDRWNFMINYDWGTDENGAAGGTKDAEWSGVAGYARYKVNDWFEPSLRVEYYDDADGWSTGLDQDIMSYTLTLNTKLGIGESKGSVVLLRPELRYDKSDKNFYTDNTDFRSTDEQWTLGVGLTWFF